ncbi:tellurite resistance/C4-dicarboxylate transporter family protein [Streptomyces sp. NPDC017405]|uniref:tellurite resistance/C4-dicarboxylate transporter family protein n=1 Tax=unclassified Streptomyces TaxID=2593676 RepID=UPI003794A50D
MRTRLHERQAPLTRIGLDERCRGLPPACFAPVMATGIVSRALDRTGAPTASGVLFCVAAALYLPLLTATAVKAARHRDVLRAELRDPARLFGHYTLVAASGVLAARLGAGPARIAGCALLTVAVTVWAALARATVRLWRARTPATLHLADGTWFLATVGLQSVVIALTSLRPARLVLAGALVLWGVGVLLYAGTLTVVLRRLRRDPPPPARLAPSYWITMGAAAISTLAGGQLLAYAELLPQPARGPLGDTVVTLWTWATLLIPPLLAAGLWRHRHHRVPLAYEPALWCIVFPAGMYATATAQLATEHRLDAALLPLGPLAWAASAAWLMVTALRLAGRPRPRFRPARRPAEAGGRSRGR